MLSVRRTLEITRFRFFSSVVHESLGSTVCVRLCVCTCARVYFCFLSVSEAFMSSSQSPSLRKAEPCFRGEPHSRGGNCFRSQPRGSTLSVWLFIKSAFWTSGPGFCFFQNCCKAITKVLFNCKVSCKCVIVALYYKKTTATESSWVVSQGYPLEFHCPGTSIS